MTDLRVALIVPGPIERTGGYIYDCRMAEGLRALGWAVEIIELRGAFPFPDAAARDRAMHVFDTLPDGAIALVDGLALGAIPDVAERHQRRIRIVALIHLPLSADLTRDAATAHQLARLERRALATAAVVVVTSNATVPMLAGYDLLPDRIAVIEPGTDRALPQSVGRPSSNRRLAATDRRPTECLCVATVNSGKGHELLLQALSTIREPWHLTCAGNLTRDPATVARVRHTIETLMLTDRVSLVGELAPADLDAAYERADVFVLATRQETYGMAVAEALAHGLPVVSTNTGAISRLVGDRAGLIVEPCDVNALSTALARIISDESLRRSLANHARAAAERLPTWADAAAQLSAALRRVAERG